MGSTLWLIGMMGVGKSTVGRMVAARASVEFVDLDDEIETAAGMTIPEIFAASGEEGFRALEASAVSEVGGRVAAVATGGGVVTRPGPVAEMRASGVVVWLDAPAGVLADRVGDGSYRPMLYGDEPARRIAEIAAARRQSYAGAAHHRIDTAGRRPEEIAEEVARLWTRS